MDTEVKKQTNQSPFSSFRSSLLSFALLTPFMVLTSFLIFGFSPPFFTTTFLILSTSILLTASTKKKRLRSSAHDPAPMNHPPEVQAAEKSQLTDEDPEYEFGDREAERQDQLSGSDGSVKSENLGLKWMTPDVDLGLNEENTSSDSGTEDDDEDGLIEIELPGCCDRNVDLILNEEAKQVNFDEFEAILKQQEYLIELLAEINEGNEEDNLIEIDISMGSIKCPSFEIQA